METEPQREPLAEIPLSGGQLTPGIIRVGNTVRRPSKGNAAFVHDLLLFLEGQGFPNLSDRMLRVVIEMPGQATFPSEFFPGAFLELLLGEHLGEG
jgi:hypothetical protein